MSELCRDVPPGGGFRESSPGQERARSWPFGLPSSRLRPYRAARAACLRPSACAPSCRTVCPPIRVHQLAHHHRSVANAPMAYPPPRLACNGLSRHILGRRLPPVFHDPLHAAQLWIVRAYRDRPTLTSRPPAAARSRSRGFAAPASRTAEKRLFTALTLGLGAARKSGGVKQFAAFLAREN